MRVKAPKNPLKILMVPASPGKSAVHVKVGRDPVSVDLDKSADPRLEVLFKEGYLVDCDFEDEIESSRDAAAAKITEKRKSAVGRALEKMRAAELDPTDEEPAKASKKASKKSRK